MMQECKTSVCLLLSVLGWLWAWKCILRMNISLADQQLILELLDVMSATKLQECRQHISAQLDGVVDFWLRHSHDAEYGYCSNTNHLVEAPVQHVWLWLLFRGFFTCIGRDGKVYDDLKYVWLQGRQVRLQGRWSTSEVRSGLMKLQREAALFSHRCGCTVVCTEPWNVSTDLKFWKQPKLVSLTLHECVLPNVCFQRLHNDWAGTFNESGVFRSRA